MEAQQIEKDAIQAVEDPTAHRIISRRNKQTRNGIVKSEQSESSAETVELSALNMRREKGELSALNTRREKDDMSAVNKTAEKYELNENNVLKIRA